MAIKKYVSFNNLSKFLDNIKNIFATKTEVSAKADKSHTHSISNITSLQAALDDKAASSHGTHVTYSATAPLMDGTSTVGTASTVARSDHRHPTDTSRAAQTSLDSHTGNTTYHITSTERNNWNTAYSHSQTAHAPSNAEANQNAFSNVKVGDVTIAADIKTDTLTLVAGNNITLTPDATNDKITISAKDTTYNLGSFGITATANELNKLDGVTATATEINYVDGVTSNIQTQLDGKAASSHTHNYAGSSSVGGAATSADKVNNSLTVKLNGGTTEGTNLFTFNGSAAKSMNITPSAIGASASGHTHDDRYYTETEVDTKLSEKANSSHGNHVPPTQTANNATFLRNDNTWQKVTPANIGAASSSHTHQVSNISDLTATATELNYMDGVTSNVQAQLDGKAASGHTHSYAGSSSSGGAATSANKLNTDAGSTTQPVYFSNGVPKATTYTLGKSVPSNAVFTDTHYASKNVVGATNATSNTATALTNGNVYLNSVENGAVTSSHKISGSGATTVTTDTSGNIIISSTDNNTTYDAAGSSLGLVKSGGDVTISSGVITVNDDSHSHIISNIDNLQASLDAKQATITGGASTIASSNLTVNRALLSNGSGKVAVSDITSTELGYLDGVTSNIQTQLEGKSNTSHTHSYAGSSSVGGSATSAVKLDTATAGDSNTPVYFSGGKPVACTSLDLNTTGSSASCTGNSATATKLSTARTISLTGDVTGSVSFDGSANASIVTTVVDDSHNHTISSVDGLQSALDGKSATSHNHNSTYISKSLQFTADNGAQKLSYYKDDGKNILTEIAALTTGFYTMYSQSGTAGNPKTTEAWRFMIHKTGNNTGWVQGYGSLGSVYTNYQDGNSGWRGWRCIWDNSPNPLWSGAMYMSSSNSVPQTVTPSKKLSECRTGWLLLWSDYDAGSGSNDADFATTIIPKTNPSGGKWGGKSFLCDIPRYVGSNAEDVDTERRIIKPIYVHDDRIEGSYQNAYDERNDVVLRAVYEI